LWRVRSGRSIITEVVKAEEGVVVVEDTGAGDVVAEAVAEVGEAGVAEAEVEEDGAVVVEADLRAA